uniref:Uncharacterized protein n=1 Tax=Cyprinus carpio TaxID=7962 RepID=A0A8C2PTF7_CYPCA
LLTTQIDIITHYHDLSCMVVHHEGHQSTQVPTGLRQDVFTGALEVILIAIKGVVVRITPRPACAVVLGHTHSIATFKAACLFLSTVEVLTWICTQRKKSHLITDYRCCVICCIIPVFCTS